MVLRLTGVLLVLAGLRIIAVARLYERILRAMATFTSAGNVRLLCGSVGLHSALACIFVGRISFHSPPHRRALPLWLLPEHSPLTTQYLTTCAELALNIKVTTQANAGSFSHQLSGDLHSSSKGEQRQSQGPEENSHSQNDQRYRKETQVPLGADPSLRWILRIVTHSLMTADRVVHSTNSRSLIVSALKTRQFSGYGLSVDGIKNCQLCSVELIVRGCRLCHYVAAQNLSVGYGPRSQNLELLPEEWKAEDREERGKDKSSNADQLQSAAFMAHTGRRFSTENAEGTECLFAASASVSAAEKEVGLAHKMALHFPRGR